MRDEFGRYKAAVIDEKLLRHKYMDEKKSVEQTAREMGVSSAPIRNCLKKLGVLRTIKEANFCRYHGENIVLDENKIKNMYVDLRMSFNKIASEVGVSSTTIHEIINKKGVARTHKEAFFNRWDNVTVDTEALVQKYVAEGKTTHKISKEMGIDAYLRLKKMGLVRSHRDSNFNRWQGKIPNIDDEHIISMYIHDQMSFEEIAKECGISCTFVFNIIKKIGGGRNADERRALSWRRMLSASLSPNRTELRIDRLIQGICPNEFILNDDTKRFSIAGKYPDWYSVNGQHKLIEYNGCYPHACPQCFDGGIFFGRTAEHVHKRDNYKLLVYDNHGYSTLVIWGHDLDEDIKNKVGEFIKQRSLNLTGGSSTNVK